MVHKTDLFKINGKPMLIPDEGVQMTYTDLDAPDSGRDESGVLQRQVAQYKVFKGEFNFSNLLEEDRLYNESLFPNEPTFEFTHPSRLDASVPVTETCYRSSYGINYRNARTGLWATYKFSVIACKGET